MEADEIFPYFISTKLPVGTAGIVLASLLAAAMSSLDSSINSICTVGIVDVLRPYVFKQRSDKSYLLMARILATFASAIMIFMAIGFYLMPKESVVDLQLIIKSLFTGAVAGFFLLGIFTTRTDYMPSLIALVAAVIFNIYLLLNAFDLLPTQMEMEVHSYWVGMLVNGLFMILAYVFSRIKRSGPAGAKVKKLTIWTMNNGNSN
jgi:SSS family solute:Na+ symporter